MYRRLTVEDGADAHIAALDRARTLGFGMFIISSPTPFSRDESVELKRDAAAVIVRHFPDAADLYAQRGWTLPTSIGRVYDSCYSSSGLNFRCKTSFREVLASSAGEKDLEND
jgi:nucleoside-diphosphate-sugar epimerase